MVQLNLLPDVKKEFLRTQRARRRTIGLAILITIVAAGATVLFAFYVYGVQSVILYTQTEDIKRQAKQLKDIKDLDKYLAIQNQLANLSQLHEDKINMSRLLTFLPTLNPAPPKNVKLTNLDVSTVEKVITFKGIVKDYASLTTFKDTLENSEYFYNVDGQETKGKLFVKVQPEAATLEGGVVTFSIIAEYDDAAFLQKNANVSVRVPNIETTQSVVGAPVPLFDGGNDAGQ